MQRSALATAVLALHLTSCKTPEGGSGLQDIRRQSLSSNTNDVFYASVDPATHLIVIHLRYCQAEDVGQPIEMRNCPERQKGPDPVVSEDLKSALVSELKGDKNTAEIFMNKLGSDRQEVVGSDDPTFAAAERAFITATTQSRQGFYCGLKKAHVTSRGIHYSFEGNHFDDTVFSLAPFDATFVTCHGCNYNEIEREMALYAKSVKIPEFAGNQIGAFAAPLCPASKMSTNVATSDRLLFNPGPLGCRKFVAELNQDYDALPVLYSEAEVKTLGQLGDNAYPPCGEGGQGYSSPLNAVFVSNGTENDGSCHQNRYCSLPGNAMRMDFDENLFPSPVK
jgi:hypothetical protein